MKNLQFEIIHDDHTEVVLKNETGDTFTYNPFHSMGLHEFIQGCAPSELPELIEAAELALSHLIYSNRQKPFLFPKGENSIEMLQNVLNKINQ